MQELEVIAVLNAKVKDLEEELKNQRDDISELKIATSVQVQQNTHILARLEEVLSDVRDMKNVPNRQKEQVISAIISCVIGVLIGFIYKM